MKITKTDLRKIIEEELGSSLKEADVATASDIKRSMREPGAAKEVGALSARERGVQQLLQQMLTAMAQPGEQANQMVMGLLQKALDKMGGAPSEVLPGEHGPGTGRGQKASRYGGTAGSGMGAPGGISVKGVTSESLDEDALVAEIIKRLGGE